MLNVAATSGAAASGLTSVARFSRRERSVALDDLKDAVGGAWGVLAGASSTLAPEPPALSVLQMDLSSAKTTFFFGPGDAWPLVVAKEPRVDGEGRDHETAALERASPSKIAPLYLGQVGRARVQEGLPGFPPWIRGLRPETAARAPAGPAFAGLADALARLAAVSARHGEPYRELLAALDLAGTAELSWQERRLVAAARRDLARLDVTVLQHGDLSPQNYLVNDGSFTGLVDWETASLEGVPGHDVLHAAVSMLEHSVGVSYWTERTVVESFRRAWPSSPLFQDAHEAMTRSVAAAGLTETLVGPLITAFFARRLGRQVGGLKSYDFGRTAVTEMVRTVCAG